MEEGRHVALWVLERLVAAVERGCSHFCNLPVESFRIPAVQLQFGIPDPQQLHTLLATLDEEVGDWEDVRWWGWWGNVVDVSGLLYLCGFVDY